MRFGLRYAHFIGSVVWSIGQSALVYADFQPAPDAMRVVAPETARLRTLRPLPAPPQTYQILVQGDQISSLSLNGSIESAYAQINPEQPYCLFELNPEYSAPTFTIPPASSFQISFHSEGAPHSPSIPSRYPWDHGNHWIWTPTWSELNRSPVQRLVCVNTPTFGQVRRALQGRIEFEVPMDETTWVARGVDYGNVQSSPGFNSREDIFSYAYYRLGQGQTFIEPLLTEKVDRLTHSVEILARLEGEQADHSFYLSHYLLPVVESTPCAEREYPPFSGRRAVYCQLHLEYWVAMKSENAVQFTPHEPLTEAIQATFRVGLPGSVDSAGQRRFPLTLFPGTSRMRLAFVDQTRACPAEDSRCHGTWGSLFATALTELQRSLDTFGSERAAVYAGGPYSASQVMVRGGQSTQSIFNTPRIRISMTDDRSVRIFPTAIEAVFNLRRNYEIVHAQNDGEPNF